MSFRDYDGPYRQPGYRIPDLQSHSDAALDLSLNPEIFRIIDVIFGEPGLAIQARYFEFGSRRQVQRDPMFVMTDPASHLLASWIALEDITEDSGPLAYVPGSHRLPYFEFTPGSVVRPEEIPAERKAAWVDWLRRTQETMSVRAFTCKRGETFIWHAGLLHGGMPIRGTRPLLGRAMSCTTPQRRPITVVQRGFASACPAVGGVRPARRTRSSVATDRVASIAHAACSNRARVSQVVVPERGFDLCQRCLAPNRVNPTDTRAPLLPLIDRHPLTRLTSVL